MAITKRRMRFSFICGTCLRSFQSNRSDAKSCSSACRKYWAVHGQPYPGAKQRADEKDMAKYNPRTPEIPWGEESEAKPVTLPATEEPITKQDLVKPPEIDQVKARSRALAKHKDSVKRRPKAKDHKNPKPRKKGSVKRGEHKA